MTAKYPSIRHRIQMPSLTLSLLLALGAAPAFAGEAATDDSAAATAAVTATATTQADDDVSRGDVIIVTARRRQETAQEVPLAISVIRGRFDRGDRQLQRREASAARADAAGLYLEPA